MNKQRLLILLSLFLITPIGFMTKFYSGPAEVWVRDSLGGMFYEIFWCLVFGFLFPKVLPQKIAGWVLLITCTLEFLQLWHPSFLELVRDNFIGRTILGNAFNWLDFPYYIVGSALGFTWLRLINRLKQDAENSGQ
jgi:hypothetical protein